MQKARKPIDIKISTVVAISAILHETDPAALEQALKDMTGGVSDFFEDEFAVLDVGALEPGDAAGIDWTALAALFKRFRLNTVAVRNAPEDLHAGIVAHGLAIDSGAATGGPANARAQENAMLASVAAAAPAPQPQAEPEPAPAPAPAPQAAPAPAARTMIVDTPVRAGQRIYARGADLVIMAAVNNGAEIIADGSIHVYAPLRGRALAGASGNTEARIFTASLEAELVSIAGVYRTFENGHPAEIAGKQVQVRLNGERIDVLQMKAS